MVTRDLSLGPTTLSITEQGEGTPIVFLHAFPLNARMWTPQLEALPPGWRGVAPDLRGFGKSPRVANPARHVRDHAEDVIALVQALGAGPAVLVGLSMGGYIAFECWRRRPTVIRGLVFADTRAEADAEDARARRVAMQDVAAREGTGAVLNAMLPGLLGATTHMANPHLSVEVRRWALETEADAVIDALEALRTRPDSRATLPNIDCPALVIVGEEDTLTPPALSRVIADGIEGATLIQVQHAGHLSNVEQPDAFSSALAHWLHGLAS
ncbi:AB hydrolase superfamily protein YdjP [Luteitalea pratensis]|jgi:pimeloyl-ACP methyl ester carboxylesterase|uniref:AB hydrolase superfamily protein YdjP n=1 Tax=Luteitalea pratensis TaxID=1855912 RepID=A0A143PUW4_LUTPR|nr:alpha/beta fold hydrolase [Luteitalea pratensis]AMY12161.1 AB hydrolase superfamily protein YdjP [Luteitalea pratensis]